jgi:hypothetical protein
MRFFGSGDLSKRHDLILVHRVESGDIAVIKKRL